MELPVFCCWLGWRVFFFCAEPNVLPNYFHCPVLCAASNIYHRDFGRGVSPRTQVCYTQLKFNRSWVFILPSSDGEYATADIFSSIFFYFTFFYFLLISLKISAICKSKLQLLQMFTLSSGHSMTDIQIQFSLHLTQLMALEEQFIIKKWRIQTS